MLEVIKKLWAPITAVVALFVSSLWYYNQVQVWKEEGHDRILSNINVIVTAILWLILIWASLKNVADSGRAKKAKNELIALKEDHRQELAFVRKQVEERVIKEQEEELRLVVEALYKDPPAELIQRCKSLLGVPYPELIVGPAPNRDQIIHQVRIGDAQKVSAQLAKWLDDIKDRNNAVEPLQKIDLQYPLRINLVGRNWRQWTDQERAMDEWQKKYGAFHSHAQNLKISLPPLDSPIPFTAVSKRLEAISRGELLDSSVPF
jgi:hypothetical protein